MKCTKASNEMKSMNNIYIYRHVISKFRLPSLEKALMEAFLFLFLFLFLRFLNIEVILIRV